MVDSLTLLLVIAVAFIATLISTKLSPSVAIIEIVLGIVLGKYLGIKRIDYGWSMFLDGLGSVVLTILTGAEIAISEGIATRSVQKRWHPGSRVNRDAVENQAQMISSGMRGRGGAARLLLGSVTHGIM
jgi:nucleotide-binding universal stress UspA family protein